MLYKLDKHGYADEICLDRIGENRDLELSGFSLERFRQMCILSGCDYLDALPGFGLKTCHKYFSKYKTAERVLQAIRAEFPAKVPEDYELQFAKAELTFCHQRVYDHRCQELVHLYPVTEEMILDERAQQFGNWDFVGPHIESAIAKGIARGQLQPVTREPFEEQIAEGDENTDTQQTVARSKTVRKKDSGPVKRSRFFQPISKEEHSDRMHKRLTIPLSNSSNENSSPVRLGQARSFSSTVASRKPVAPIRRFATKKTLAQDMASSRIPTQLYGERSLAHAQSTGATLSTPVRLDSAQISLLSFLKKT